MPAMIAPAGLNRPRAHASRKSSAQQPYPTTKNGSVAGETSYLTGGVLAEAMVSPVTDASSSSASTHGQSRPRLTVISA